MTAKDDKGRASPADQTVDKRQARRQRQARALRQNLSRRKAQIRDRAGKRTGDDVGMARRGDDPTP